MFIKQALAEDAPVTPLVTTASNEAQTVAQTIPAGTPPSSTEMLLLNAGFVVVMIVLFYFLLIRPQQQRYKEHANMLGQLKKGDKVVLQSGMIATIDHMANDNQEMTVEFVAGHKAQVLRSAIAGKYETIVKTK